MLLELNIRNFSIIQELSIDFGAGMTIITGETGAGKSILIDALALCLGERADVDLIRQGDERAEISALFCLNELPFAQAWLKENDLNEEDKCILRRILTLDGRSRAFINGRSVSLSQLKTLGQALIQIHGQNTHQAMLRPDEQRYLLDQYAQTHDLLGSLKQNIEQWRNTQRALDNYLTTQQEQQVRLELLTYQLKELKEFAPQAEEFVLVEQEHKRLSNSGKIVEICSTASRLLSGDQEMSSLSLLQQAKRQLEELVSLDNNMVTFYSQLEEAFIQLTALAEELDYYGQNIDLDSAQLVHLEARLTGYLTLARKHQVKPDELYELYQRLKIEYQTIRGDEAQEKHLREQLESHHQVCLTLAQQIHERRVTRAVLLNQQMTASMHELAMPHGQFEVSVEYQSDRLNEFGSDRIEFLVTTNPGQPLGALSKIVSGGELSRLALALQVITAQQRGITGMIFDEIDTGISGSTASRVGQLLKQLAKLTQVMCVTHLPQVAGYGDQHFFVDKKIVDNQTLATITLLDKQGRLYELARLLSGGKITQNSLANAEELLVI